MKIHSVALAAMMILTWVHYTDGGSVWWFLLFWLCSSDTGAVISGEFLRSLTERKAGEPDE